MTDWNDNEDLNALDSHLTKNAGSPRPPRPTPEAASAQPGAKKSSGNKANKKKVTRRKSMMSQ